MIIYKHSLIKKEGVIDPSEKGKARGFNIPVSNGELCVDRAEIISCKAGKESTILIFVGTKKIYSVKRLKYFEEQLGKYNFFKVCHSRLINVNQVEQYFKAGSGQILMKNGEYIGISKRRKRPFLDHLKSQYLMI